MSDHRADASSREDSAGPSKKDPPTPSNPELQRYYSSWESRLGYRLVLGGTRHFGYYDDPTSHGLRVRRSLRAMEAQLVGALALPPGSRVLDAGCGAGHVAIAAARSGLLVTAIDAVPRHAAAAARNARAAGLAHAVAARPGNYEDLAWLGAGALDGAYTMETLVHARDAPAALAGLARALRPGARLVLHEYDHVPWGDVPAGLRAPLDAVNAGAAMPAYATFERGVLERLVAEAGFVDVKLVDLSAHVAPMLRLFHALALVPFHVVSLLGLRARFVNTVAGYYGYVGRRDWRYVQISATRAGG